MENGRCLLNQSVVKARRLRCVWLYALSGSGGPELEKIGQTSGPLNTLRQSSCVQRREVIRRAS